MGLESFIHRCISCFFYFESYPKVIAFYVICKICSLLVYALLIKYTQELYLTSLSCGLIDLVWQCLLYEFWLCDFRYTRGLKTTRYGNTRLFEQSSISQITISTSTDNTNINKKTSTCTIWNISVDSENQMKISTVGFYFSDSVRSLFRVNKWYSTIITHAWVTCMWRIFETYIHILRNNISALLLHLC